MNNNPGQLMVTLKKDQILCLAGDLDTDLYIIHSGKLMVCVNKGTQITPIAYLTKGEYFGELSFFDSQPRSAHVISIEDTSLIRIPVDEKEKQFPRWLLSIAQSLTKKIRRTSDIIRVKGIRKKNVETIKPLSIEEQRHYYQIIKNHTG